MQNNNNNINNIFFQFFVLLAASASLMFFFVCCCFSPYALSCSSSPSGAVSCLILLSSDLFSCQPRTAVSFFLISHSSTALSSIKGAKRVTGLTSILGVRLRLWHFHSQTSMRNSKTALRCRKINIQQVVWLGSSEEEKLVFLFLFIL